MFLHPGMQGLEGTIKVAQEEIGYLDIAYQEKVYGELKSLIRTLDLDKLLLDYPEEAQLIAQRKAEFMDHTDRLLRHINRYFFYFEQKMIRMKCLHIVKGV